MLNTQHPHLKFAIKKATESLTFSEVEIKIFDNGFEHSVHRKVSNTGLVLNNYANCPKICKSG